MVLRYEKVLIVNTGTMKRFKDKMIKRYKKIHNEKKRYKKGSNVKGNK